MRWCSMTIDNICCVYPCLFAGWCQFPDNDVALCECNLCKYFVDPFMSIAVTGSETKWLWLLTFFNKNKTNKKKKKNKSLIHLGLDWALTLNLIFRWIRILTAYAHQQTGQNASNGQKECYWHQNEPGQLKSEQRGCFVTFESAK